MNAPSEDANATGLLTLTTEADNAARELDAVDDTTSWPERAGLDALSMTNHVRNAFYTRYLSLRCRCSYLLSF